MNIIGLINDDIYYYQDGSVVWRTEIRKERMTNKNCSVFLEYSIVSVLSEDTFSLIWE